MNIPSARRRVLSTRAPLLLLFILLNAPVLLADSVNTLERTMTKVAEGVYVIRHKDAPDGFPQGNTTVIVGDRDVFVVDSCYLPSAAREDIAQIKQLTDKPVRYLLNTHWHYDHTLGNGAYGEAFPMLAIIAHTETRKQIEGYNPGWFERYPKRTATFKAMLATGKEEDGRPLTDARKKEISDTLSGREPVGVEFKGLADRLPNVMFDHDLIIDIGNREVHVKHLGRGNTAGDAIVYLPREKILIAGDLLDHPVPYLGGGYPSELIATLQSMALLDAQTIVPGHGGLLRDKAYLTLVIDFLKTVVSQVNKEVYRLGNSSRVLDDVQRAVEQAVDMSSWRQRFAGDDKDNREFFDSFSFPGLVKAAYAELWRR
ncbi:MAG TPA: MBL fold metallo-hydrolase [Blastocatellia bacterium]|jgi:glyoxylase-like metal-dependent hydrolase (beta-lactamase superfamily II)|nr:MBL fold metallo-hydrolase [Blastocatellia bacterium]